MMNHFILYMIVLVLESFVGGAGGVQQIIFGRVQGLKCFVIRLNFLQMNLIFSRRGVGVMARWTSLLPFVPKVSLLFHIIHKTVVMNMCRKLSLEQSIK